MTISLGELAVRFGCELRGDPSIEVDGVASLGHAHGRSVAFLADPRLRAQLDGTRAAAVVLGRDHANACPVAALVAENPRATYARIAALLNPRERPPAGIHPSAVIAAGARIDASVHIGALAVIAAGAEIGARSVVGPHSIVGAGARLEEEVWLVARVTLGERVRLGARTLVHPGAVIGSDGFGFAEESGAWIKVPQVGSVRIGADVEIGANTTIDRGAIDDTVIEEGVKLDNLIQIGHNVRIGAHTAIAGCTGISGSTAIGRHCMIGGAVSIGGWLTICDGVVITGTSMISHSITRPGVYSSGIPFEEARSWRKLVARFKRLSSLYDRVAELEQRARGGGRAAGKGARDD
ncbi:MAG TPA: UDP-3-O-(3-hydroxymyristoyl)glucosamine N-acyltransferase [Steroidobacteraceae bacterium]|nr:UDP-3-O-(3-hydroxymyristoyl)glucosamine N-acyltransferase [Steroidobacteraceae bacterium]